MTVTTHWLSTASYEIGQFTAQLEQAADAAGPYSLASDIVQNVPVYSGATLAQNGDALLTEWGQVLATGPGIIVIKNALSDHTIIDRATAVFDSIIEAERGTTSGDHFAKAGANDRIWNAAQKHCMADPENFTRYYSADAIALAATAWLGPGYQLTAQVNRVNPGGAAQTPHRDYHLGFMTPDQSAKYPAPIHRLSPLLTLQGAVAHCDMPLESGPTVYLPFSQLFEPGYIAFSQPAFQDYFAQNHIQLPLSKGDAVFFNPALMHGAGHNRSTDIYRMANLLQISSGFGRAMEVLDRSAMCKMSYGALGALSGRAQANALAAIAEGYAFPTNLDSDPPVGGLAPETQADLMREALSKKYSQSQIESSLDALATRQRA